MTIEIKAPPTPHEFGDAVVVIRGGLPQSVIVGNIIGNDTEDFVSSDSLNALSADVAGLANDVTILDSDLTASQLSNEDRFVALETAINSLTQSFNTVIPLEGAYIVTPSDTVDLTTPARAIYLGTGGDLKVTLKSGNIVTFANLDQGFQPIQVTRVWATGTTATNILAGT